MISTFLRGVNLRERFVVYEVVIIKKVKKCSKAKNRNDKKTHRN